MNSYDVAIVGGSNAGLSAAMTLGRARRRVAVIDDSRPRNASASHAHNIFTRDGTSPEALRRVGREQLGAYDVHFVRARVTKAGGVKGSFQLTLDTNKILNAARVVLATGVSDDVPGIPGLRKLWGKRVFTCPYCHGWEVRDKPLAVIGGGSTEHYHYAHLIQHWSRDLVFVIGDNPVLTSKQLDGLGARGIRIIQAEATRFEHDEGDLRAIHLSNGQTLERHAAFMPMPMSLRGDLHTQLGCEVSKDPLKLVVDEMNQTSVKGVYAAGDIVTTPMHSVTFAVASAQKTASMLNQDMIMEAIR